MRRAAAPRAVIHRFARPHQQLFEFELLALRGVRGQQISQDRLELGDVQFAKHHDPDQNEPGAERAPATTRFTFPCRTPPLLAAAADFLVRLLRQALQVRS
jgi:hypothetical protein